MKVCITGANGLLGWHTHCRIHTIEGMDAVVIPRKALQDPQKLKNLFEGCDVIIHLACLIRGEDEEILTENALITKNIIAALTECTTKPHLIFANSTQSTADNAYGRSKASSAIDFKAWASEHNAKFSDFILPHIFGEGGKPFHNAAIHTFCHQLAHDIKLTVTGDKEVELLHAGDVADLMLDAISTGKTGQVRPNGTAIKITDLAKKLENLYTSYMDDKIIPDLRDPVDLRIFNTLRSYIYPDKMPVALTLHTDPRGSLFEAVREKNGGQSFVSTTKSGITRGDHFHYHKVERFLVVKGTAKIRIRKILSDHIDEFIVTGEKPVYIDMPTGHTHNITNIGDDELLTLFWTHEIFNPDNSDTYFEPV